MFVWLIKWNQSRFQSHNPIFHSAHFQFINFPSIIELNHSFHLPVSPVMKIKPTLFSKVTLTTYGPHAFDYNVEQQLTSKDAFESEKLWAYSFNNWFSAPEASKGPPCSAYRMFLMAIYVLLLGKTSQVDLKRNKYSLLLLQVPNKELHCRKFSLAYSFWR